MSLPKILLIILLSIISSNCIADIKNKIISELNSTNTLEFNFDQHINGVSEKGRCLLEFPGKLKCYYSDKKRKELVINSKKLAITQKRYNKTYYYPTSKSSFVNILYKEKLAEIVKLGELSSLSQRIELLHFDENKIIVFFDKKNFELKGWKVKDQYNNEIIFNLAILKKNFSIDKKVFQIPNIN